MLIRELETLLPRILLKSPEQFGYSTYHGRFGWTIPKIRDCLRTHFGISASRAMVRRVLDQAGYAWEHKRFTRVAR